jgi:hypothetical protein
VPTGKYEIAGDYRIDGTLARRNHGCVQICSLMTFTDDGLENMPYGMWPDKPG